MSDIGDSDNSFDGGDWAVVDAQGELAVSDGDSSTSSSSIEVVEIEELEEAAAQDEREKSNLQRSFPQFVADGEGMELQQLMMQAGEADNVQPLQSVGSDIVTAPVVAASFHPLQSLLSALQEPSRTSPSRKQPEGEETESQTVCVQTSQDRISHADKMSETERILKTEQTTQTYTAAPELSDHRLSLSSLWSFSLNSGGTDETSGSDCGSVESDRGEQNLPFATETSSADTQDHQEKEQQPEKEQQKGGISASFMSPGPEGLQSPPQYSPKEQGLQELVQPQQAKASESQQKGGISASSTSPGPERSQSPPQHSPREQGRPEVQELVRPQQAKSSELQQNAGSSRSAVSPDPERPQSPPQPRQAESPVSQSPQQVSLRFGGSQDEAASPDTNLRRRKNMTTTTIHLTVGPMSTDTSEDPEKIDKGWLQRFLDFDIVLLLLTVIFCFLLGLVVGRSQWSVMQEAYEEQLQQAVVKHKHCLSEFGHLEKQTAAVLQGEQARHEKRVRELQDQHQVLTQHLEEAQQQVEHLRTEREQQQTTERTSSEKSSTPGQNEHGQKAAEVWRHLYFSLKEEREIGGMNASACIQFLSRRINSKAILQYLTQCWEESQVWTESMMDTSFWLSGLSSLQEKAAQRVSAAMKEMPSTISETYQALFRTVFQSAQHQPHDRDTKEDGEREGWGGSVDENEEDVTIESEDELEMKSQEYEAYRENKHKKKWTKTINRFLKKTQKVMFRVGNKLHKTWRKIKNKSVQFLSEKPAFGRMAAKLRNNFNTLYSSLQKKTQDLFMEHSEAKPYSSKEFHKQEEQRKKPKQDSRETEKRVSDKGDENEQKERMTKQVVEEENKERGTAAVYSKNGKGEKSDKEKENGVPAEANKIETEHPEDHHETKIQMQEAEDMKESSNAKTRFQIQSQFQQLYNKVGSMNVEDWVHSDASELMKDMELVSKQYDSLHLDLPISGRQWLVCQHAFWTSVVAHRELSEPSLECYKFMAPWQLAVIEEQGSASSPPGKIQEVSASGKDNPWTSVDHTDMHNTNSDVDDDHQCSGDDCHA